MVHYATSLLLSEKKERKTSLNEIPYAVDQGMKAYAFQICCEITRVYQPFIKTARSKEDLLNMLGIYCFCIQIESVELLKRKYNYCSAFIAILLQILLTENYWGNSDFL